MHKRSEVRPYSTHVFVRVECRPKTHHLLRAPWTLSGARAHACIVLMSASISDVRSAMPVVNSDSKLI